MIYEQIEWENVHKHTKYSNVSTMDSILSIEDIAKRAVELGHKTLSTVEHGFAGDVFGYYDVAKKYGLKFIFGVEYYYVHDRFSKDKTNSHILILAKNSNGKRQLTKLISESNVNGFYYKNRIDKELLFSLNPTDVVVTSACIGGIYGKYDDKEFILECFNHFGSNFYLGLHANTHPKQTEYNKKLLNLHNEYKIPFMFEADTHYIYPEDSKWRDLLLRGKGMFYEDEDDFVMDYPDTETIFERFAEQDVFTQEQVKQALKNTLIVRDFEDIIMDKEIKMPSIYPNFTHEQKVQKLKDIITYEWIKDREHISKKDYPKYLDAIRFEMDIIEKTHTEDYFLLNYDIIKRAKEKGGILTRTGRGSAPSFYLNKLLGFTEIDRLDAPITLYPTRFMSISRILETRSLPDIDFNTVDPQPFVESAKEIVGDDNVYWMISYGTMQESEAFRHMCRALGMHDDSTEVNEVGKNLDQYRNHAKWKDIIEDSKMFIGVINSVSPHPCANLLLSEPISEEVGIYRVGDESKGKKKIVYCALIDSDTSDAWKYLKNDFLTVTVWKIIADVFNAINQPIPDIRTLNRLVENEKDVWDLYANGLTATLNQVGTESGTPQVVQYKPTSVRELTGWVSAIRPSFASMKHYFLNREPFSYGIPEFDTILKESDNFILYQENIMSALVYAGFSEDVTYGLLKAISKKKEGIIEPIHDKFIQGFIDKTGSEENALRVWKILEDSVGYGFNSSHSYAYALDSIYGAYLKAKYPLDYYKIVLNIYEKNVKIQSKLMKELEYFDIKVKPIEFGKARAEYEADYKTNTIYKGIASIKNLNGHIAESLYKLAQEKDYDKNDFISLLLDIHRLSSNERPDAGQMEILIKLDFFKMFGEKEVLLEIYQCFADRKKANTDLYPEFAEQKHLEKIVKKCDGSLEEKWKTIKRLVAYKPDLKDKNFEERMQNIYDYEKAVKQNPPPKIELYDQIQFEKEILGYALSVYENCDEDICVVLAIDTQYSPKITLYRLHNGEEFVVKIAKKKFYINDGQSLFNGDIIKILELRIKNAMKKIENEWVENTAKQDLWLERLQMIKRGKMIE